MENVYVVYVHYYGLDVVAGVNDTLEQAEKMLQKCNEKFDTDGYSTSIAVIKKNRVVIDNEEYIF